jgi:hypothetical protein
MRYVWTVSEGTVCYGAVANLKVRVALALWRLHRLHCGVCTVCTVVLIMVL